MGRSTGSVDTGLQLREPTTKVGITRKPTCPTIEFVDRRGQQLSGPSQTAADRSLGYLQHASELRPAEAFPVVQLEQDLKLQRKPA